MPERSHETGRDYQQAVKKWLTQASLFGLCAAPFGDAYDATNKATRLGSKTYDLSLSLRRTDKAEKVLYVECKYRNEISGNVNSAFTEFVKNSYIALSDSSADEVDCSMVLFVSNIPPTDWRDMLKSKTSYVRHVMGGESGLDDVLVDALAAKLHVLVLGTALIGA